MYADLAIETALTFRKLFRLPLRQTEGFVQSLLGMMGLPLNAPDHTTFSRRQKGLAVNLPVHPSDRPRHLMVDSTGLKLYGEGEWKTRQHGWTKRRTWRKLHLGIDADTGEVVAQTLTQAATDDASQVKPMLVQTPGEIARLYGDGAYDRWKVHYPLAYPPEQDTSIESVIPPRHDRRSGRRNDATGISKPATSACKQLDGRDGKDGNETVDIIDDRWQKPASSASRSSWVRNSKREVGKGSKSKRASDVVYSIE